jgi:hypothetical protein
MLKPKIIFIVSYLPLLVAIGLYFVFLSGVNHPLIIHFDKYNGIDLWGTPRDVFKIIIFGFVLNVINLGLARALRNRVVIPRVETSKDSFTLDRIFPYLLSFLNLFLSILILIAVGVIISVN